LKVEGFNSEELSIDVSHEEVAPVDDEGSDGVGSALPHETRVARSSSKKSVTGGVGEASGDEGTSVLISGGDGMSRPFGSIHGGFGSMASNDAPVPDMKSDTPTLSEKHTRDLRDALYERDKSLGLGADGPVIQALETSAQASTAPVNGRAVFDIVVGSDGIVTSLTVSEGGIAWSGVAKDALDAVRGKKARIPASAKNGVAMRIEVDSRVLLPSGHSPTTAIDIAGIPITKGDDKSTKVSILKPQIFTAPLDPEGKIQIPMASFTIIGTNGDPADIGARPRRVIHSKVLEQHVL
jgi:hypothetical protein